MIDPNDQLKILQDQLAAAQKQIENLQTSNQGYDATISTLTQERDKWQTQFTELEAKIPEFETQIRGLSEANTQLAATAKEVEDWKLENEPKINALSVITSDPKYHGLIGMMGDLNMSGTVEEIQQRLDRVASTIKTTVDDAKKQYQAGSTEIDPKNTPASPNQTPKTTDDFVKLAYQQAMQGRSVAPIAQAAGASAANGNGQEN